MPLAQADRAAGAFAYMKGVAPFLGVAAPTRRTALREAWNGLPLPTSRTLGQTARELLALPEREFHYAACDLIERFTLVPDARFLPTFGAHLLTTKPWWDTVDSLVTVMVSPQVRRFAHHDLIDAWSESGDRWLVRAAICHQRGWKQDTDVRRVLALCDRHWHEREFFIAKAIGWAMRDIARIDPSPVRSFLETHDCRNRVAIREAERGLAIPSSVRKQRSARHS